MWLVINSVAHRHLLGCARVLPPTHQYTNSVFAVISGQGNEFVEDLDTVAERRTAISLSQPMVNSLRVVMLRSAAGQSGG